MFRYEGWGFLGMYTFRGGGCRCLGVGVFRGMCINN